jgi:predicted ester cyclase
MSDTEANKAIVRDFLARINEGDLAGGAALCAEDLVNHAALPSAQGRAGLVTIFTKLRAAFPDLRFETDAVIAEGDRVVSIGSMVGTHDGTFTMSPMPWPATGRAFRTQHIHVFRVAGGQLVEHWAGRDDAGMMRQLGVWERLT